MKFVRDLLVCVLLVAAIVVVLHLGGVLLDTDRAINSITQDSHLTALAIQYRLDRTDAVIDKAGKSLDSLDSAIKAHKAATVRASDELHGTFQNANAFLIQMGLSADEVRLASSAQRISLTEQNKELTAAIKDARTVLADLDAQVKDPAIHQTFDNVNITTSEIRQAVNELTHPPKSTRGQKALRFFLQVILGNSVQGAVRR